MYIGASMRNMPEGTREWILSQEKHLSKSKFEICQIFHFNEEGIKVHVSICFVALKVYRELDRMLKTTR